MLILRTGILKTHGDADILMFDVVIGKRPTLRAVGEITTIVTALQSTCFQPSV